MHLSSILVYANPTQLDDILFQLSLLPSVEIHYQCRESGRIVLVQEHASTQQQIEGLNKVKSIQGVCAAELVYHYVEEGHGPEISSSSGEFKEQKTWA